MGSSHLNVIFALVVTHSYMLLLTCPIVFKAVQKMKNHHHQGMQRDECNVHLKCKETLGVTLSNTLSCCCCSCST